MANRDPRLRPRAARDMGLYGLRHTVRNRMRRWARRDPRPTLMGAGGTADRSKPTRPPSPHAAREPQKTRQS
jgi:hypothetical protein